MLAFLLLTSSVATINPAMGYNNTSPSPVMSGTITMGHPHPYICKDGSRPESPGPIISKCRAEFLGGITIRGWTGPFYNPIPGVIMPWTGRCQDSTQWSKRDGGDGRFYSDPDFLPTGRPRKGSKPCL